VNFRFVNVVWGDTYTDLFLNVVLPNQLSSGNLGIFRGREGAVYRIYTTSKDAENIKISPAFLKLSGIMSSEIALIDDVNIENKYSALIECHRRAIRAAGNDCAALVFLSPDVIYADGTFTNLTRLAAAGNRAVMVATIRLVKETFVPVFLERCYSKDDLTAPISSRELVKLALNHLHPITKSLFWHSTEFNREWPSHLYWGIGQEGLLARCFNPSTLMVNPRRRGILPRSTVDNDYVLLACPNPEDLYVVEDSDEIAGFEISSLSEPVGQMVHWGKIERNVSNIIEVAAWAKYHTNSHHREFLRHRIRFHFNDVSENWYKVEHLSDKVVDTILWPPGKYKIPMLLYIPRWTYRRIKTRMTYTRIKNYCIRNLARLRSRIGRDV